MSSPLRITIVVVAVIAMAVQFVGMMVPAWIRIDIKSPDEGIYIETDIGIWLARGCVKKDTFREICATVEMDQAISNSKAASGDMEGLILKLKLLTVIGIIGAFCGTCVGIVHARKGDASGSKTTLVVGLFAWILSGVLVIAAVGSQLHEHSNMKEGLDMASSALDELNVDINILFPWATIVSGIGALLAFLSAILVGVEISKQGTDGGQQGMAIGYKA